MTADDPAMGPDFDFPDGGVLGTAEGGKGSAAAPATALLRGEFVLLADGGWKYLSTGVHVADPEQVERDMEGQIWW